MLRTLKSEADQPSGAAVSAGDEVNFIGKNQVCFLSREDGSQLGIEVEGGTPRLVSNPYGYADGAWTRQKTMAVAAALARQAGLSGQVEHVEGSISTIHRVLIKP